MPELESARLLDAGARNQERAHLLTELLARHADYLRVLHCRVLPQQLRAEHIIQQ